MNILIRQATPDDANGIAAVITPIQQEEFGIPITYEQQPDLMDIASFYQTGGGGFWVTETNAKIIATIGLKDIGNNEGALRKMFVQGDFRGKPHNVAGKLLAHLFNHARKNSLQTIYLGTTTKFHAAHKFYEKTGFTKIDAEALPAAFPRMAVDTIFYKIVL